MSGTTFEDGWLFIGGGLSFEFGGVWSANTNIFNISKRTSLPAPFLDPQFQTQFIIPHHPRLHDHIPRLFYLDGPAINLKFYMQINSV